MALRRLVSGRRAAPPRIRARARTANAGGGLRRLGDDVLRAVSLVVTDRRWAAPLSAMALGFGLFLGVAIGPGANGTLATGAAPILALTTGESEEPAEAPAAAETETAGGGGEEAWGGGGGLEPAPEPEYAPEPLYAEEAPLEAEAPPPPTRQEMPPATEPEPGELESSELRGTVVHANPAAGSYTMAIAGGELVSVHAPELPAAGAKLAVEATPLPNNTFAEEGRQKLGTAQGTSFSGVVTYVGADLARPTYTVSGRGSSILVYGQVGAQLPQLGAYATVSARIAAASEGPAGAAAATGAGTAAAPDPAAVPVAPAPVADPALAAPVPPPAADPAIAAVPSPAPSCLPDPALKPPPEPRRIVVERSLRTEAEPAVYVDLAGVVSAVCAEAGQLLLSADDQRASGADILLSVPPSLRTDRLRVGDSVLATATIAEGGALELSGLASDEGLEGAESRADAQGDLKR